MMMMMCFGFSGCNGTDYEERTEVGYSSHSGTPDLVPQKLRAVLILPFQFSILQ